MNINKLCQNIILNSLVEDYDGNDLVSIDDKITFLMMRIESEYGWLIKRDGLAKAASEWCQGLALDVPFYNGHILEILARYDVISSRSDSFNVDRYWLALGKAIQSLITGLNRVKSETQINVEWSVCK